MDPIAQAKMIAKAAARTAPPPLVEAGKLRELKKEAIRIHRLILKGAARGAAPMPGQAAPPPADLASKAAKRAPIPKVVKYRALTDSAADSKIAYQAGATVFVMGEVDGDGKVLAVVNGVQGDVVMSTITLITPELLAAEKQAREEVAEEVYAAKEEEINANTEEATKSALAALEEKYADKGDGGDTSAADAEQEAASQKIAADAAAAIAEAKAAEDEIKRQAAELERLMAELDMSSDEED